MIAPLSRFIDWSAFQIFSLMLPPGHAQNPRLEQALQILNQPDFIPAESQPARVEFGPDESGVHFRFPTPQPGRLAENNIAYGRLHRCADRWQNRPVLVLLHGWGDFAGYHLRFRLLAHRCNRAGLNTAMLVAPFHFQRGPRRREAGSHPDCSQLAEAVSQAVAEIRALTGWLLQEGCPGVALWGFSLGAWYAGMTACHDARLAAVVLNAPAVRMNPWLEEVAVNPRIRATLQKGRDLCNKLNLTALNLTLAQPAIARDKILLIEGMHDLAVPKKDVEDLWQVWGQPDIWRLPHGHVTVCCGGVPGLTARVLRWLAARLEKPGLREQPEHAAQSDGPANQRQQIRAETNRTSEATGPVADLIARSLCPVSLWHT
jgi:dienelactone hydrolase